MGILRSDVVSHSQLGGPGGSVQFDGVDDALKTADSDTYALKTNDFTIECWMYSTANNAYDCWFSNDDYVSGAGGIALYKNQSQLTAIVNGTTAGGSIFDGVGTVSLNTWHHVAFVRESGNYRYYLNGEVIGETATQGSYNIVGNSLIIAANNYDNAYPNYEYPGYISNLRVINGRAVYGPGNFTVPKFKLKNIPGTVLLCCQSSSSTTEAAVGDGALSANSAPVASGFAPDLKEDITDTGVVFGDNTKFDTLSYMVPPGGTTTESNRGRAIFMGGYLNPSLRSEIYYVQMQSQGNAVLFGDLSGDNGGEGSSCASSTRALQGGGSLINTINYITIATTSNSTDFGDITVARRSLTALSSNTRGIWAGGTTNPAMSDVIDYATIATTGNATDFVNLTEGRRNPAVGSITSTTRGVFAGGNPGSSPLHTNVIDYITIASTGNATDFGDQVLAMREQGGASSSIRGLIAGGYTSPANLNRIEYITIASTGNAADFGDLNITPGAAAGTSNKTRALFAGGSTPYNNSMEYATIATTGNAKDFGDLPVNRMFYGGTSDSHGGIS